MKHHGNSHLAYPRMKRSQWWWWWKPVASNYVNIKMIVQVVVTRDKYNLFQISGLAFWGPANPSLNRDFVGTPLDRSNLNNPHFSIACNNKMKQ